MHGCLYHISQIEFRKPRRKEHDEKDKDDDNEAFNTLEGEITWLGSGAM